MAETFQKQLAALKEELAESKTLLQAIHTRAVSDGGKLTAFGEDLVHTCVKHGMPTGEIAKLVGVTPSAISQRAKQLLGE